MPPIILTSQLMCTNVVTASKETPLDQIVSMMQHHRISSIVITEDARPIGIITERDIVTATLQPDLGMTRQAQTLMSTPVISIHHNSDYREAYLKMVEENIRHLVVIDAEAKAAGVISESDFLDLLNVEELIAVKDVANVMTYNVITCHNTDSVESVLSRMRQYRISNLVVVHENKPIGIISERDALKIIQLGPDVLQQSIASFMSTPVITIKKSDSVMAARTTMTQKHIRHVVVIDNDGNLSGIVTRHDLMKNVPNHYVNLLKEIIELQRENIEKANQAIEEKMLYQNAMESLPHTLVFATNSDGVVTFVNQKMAHECTIDVLEPGTIMASLSNPLFDVIKDVKNLQTVLNGAPCYKIIKLNEKLETSCYFHTSLSPIYNHKGHFEGYMFIARDVSSQKQLESRLRHTNALLIAIRKINQLIIKEDRVGALLQKICDQIITVPSFQGAWIVYQAGSKQQLFSSGFDNEALQQVKKEFTTGNSPLCCNSTQEALGIFENPSHACGCFTGYSGTDDVAITVPLMYENRHYGHLCLVVSRMVANDKEEQQIIQEVGDDIAFSLFTFEQERLVALAQKRLRQSTAIFENTNEGVMITDAQGVIIDINRAFETITSYSRSETIGKKSSLLQSGRHDKVFYENMWHSISKNGSWLGEIWNRRKNGEIYPQWLNITRMGSDQDENENYIAIFSDISDLKANEEKVDFLFYHDHLTELPNRVLLKARLEHTLNAGHRYKNMTAVLFIDLDNFKHINEVYGHTMGDQVLVEASKRLSRLLSEDDTLARIGGDEFVIVMSNIINTALITTMAQKIVQSFNVAFMIGHQEFWITSSIGISIAPDDGMSAEILIKNADAAMYDAKNDGKNIFKFYNDKMTANSFERVVFESALKNAVSNGEFELYYQPQQALENDCIIGFEALLRWKHPSFGMVTPDRFIPIAEETKMIVPIGEFVLERACSDIAAWHNHGLFKGRVAINVSGVQLEHSEFADVLKQKMSHHGVDASMLEIEVTESMVMKDPERWIRIIGEIKRIGVTISIDDFGTGYSSLSYLRRLPVDTLKIDRSFVLDLPHEQDACAIADAIISMSKSLGLKVIAEGVETDEQRHYLLKSGCDSMQGFLLARPMNSSDVFTWIQKRTEVI